MVILSFVLLGVLAGLVRGGTFAKLVAMPMRFGWVVILACLIQLILFLSPFETLPNAADLIAPLYLLSFLLLLAVVALNHSLTGMKLLGLGLFLNFLVIAINGGFMPASIEQMENAGLVKQAAVLRDGSRASHLVAADENTRLIFLGDVYSIPSPLPFRTVFSIGDVIIGLGALRLTYKGMFYRRRYSFRTTW